MNEKPKSKILVIIIGILLSANILLLSFLLWNGNKDGKKDGRSRKQYAREYLEKDMGFTKTQIDRYDSLSKMNREKMKSGYNALAPNRKRIFVDLGLADFSDSAINKTVNLLQSQQRNLETNMLMHLKDIRDICTETQRSQFDTSFYKIFGRRGEASKEK